MNHPTYPLQLEQRAEIIMSPNDAVTIRRIQRQFAKRRDAEFPGWREEYEHQIHRWLASQKRGERNRQHRGKPTKPRS